jgi:DNA-binding response OmpR family regulator
MKILIADNQSVIRQTLDIKFKQAGYITHTAQNGREAMAALNTFQPDIVICDALLPYITGYEILAYLRKTRYEHVPFLLLSQFGQEDNVVHAFDLGADDYILKPFITQEVVARAKRCLRQVSLATAV